MTLLSCWAESRPLRSSSIAFLRLEPPRFSMFQSLHTSWTNLVVCGLSLTHPLNWTIYIIYTHEGRRNIIMWNNTRGAPTCCNAHMLRSLKEPCHENSNPFQHEIGYPRSTLARESQQRFGIRHVYWFWDGVSLWSMGNDGALGWMSPERKWRHRTYVAIDVMEQMAVSDWLSKEK